MKKKFEGEIILEESYGSNIKKRLYVKPPEQESIVIIEKTFMKDVYNWFAKIFLPQGFPNSVSKDYVSYQIWDTAQAFCSTIAGIIATQEILRGVGVGDQNATPLAATVTWVVKDGCGHLGKILFAYTHGSYLDAYSKKWRLYADILNDLAMCFEIALPYFRSYTTFVLCASSSMKAVVGVAGGATRVAMTQHHALRGNMADVSAKDAAQETAVNLIASLLALAIINMFGTSIIIFSLMITLHITFNYLVVRAVCLRTLNVPRFLKLIGAYLKYEVIHSPCEANRMEPIVYNVGSIPSDDVKFSGFRIMLGYSFKKAAKARLEYSHLHFIKELYESRPYLIYADTVNREMYIMLKENATNDDTLCSYFHAVLLAIIISSPLNDVPLEICKSSTRPRPFIQICDMLKEAEWAKKPKKTSNGRGFLYDPSHDLLKYVNKIAYSEWRQVLYQGLNATGWDLEKNLLVADEWRVCRSRENLPVTPLITNTTLHQSEVKERFAEAFTIEPDKNIAVGCSSFSCALIDVK